MTKGKLSQSYRFLIKLHFKWYLCEFSWITEQQTSFQSPYRLLLKIPDYNPTGNSPPSPHPHPLPRIFFDALHSTVNSVSDNGFANQLNLSSVTTHPLSHTSQLVCVILVEVKVSKDLDEKQLQQYNKDLYIRWWDWLIIYW